MGDIYYVNKASSTERREKMEEHLREMNVNATRLEGVRLDATTVGAFSDSDKAVLEKAYGSWSCGEWAPGRCEDGDKVCCWGFSDALQMTEHIESNNVGVVDKVRGTQFLGSAVSKILAMKEIQAKCQADATKCLPALLLEDDARLNEDWELGVAAVMEVLGPDGFDVVKLHSKAGTTPRDCVSRCSPQLQCFEKESPTCKSWGMTALLVNAYRVDKILATVEAHSKKNTADVFAGKRIYDVYATRDRFSIDNGLTLGAVEGGLDLYLARPNVVSVDLELNKKTTFNNS